MQRFLICKILYIALWHYHNSTASNVNSSNISHSSAIKIIVYLHYPPAGVISSVPVSAPLPTAVHPVSFYGNQQVAHAQILGAEEDTLQLDVETV